MSTTKEIPKSGLFNEDELEPPKWINLKFVEQVLRENDLDSDIKVQKVSISPASMKGDHYASVMFRILVDYTIKQSKHTKQRSIIIKTLPDFGTKREMLDNSTIFECETKMYGDIIPKIESILRTIGDDTKIAPHCIYRSLEPQKVLIFEDLVEQGYEVVRNRPIRMDEVKKAYEKIAKFHAVSYELNRKEPELLKSFENGLVSVKGFMDNNSVRYGGRNFVELLKEIPEFEKYIQYFDGIDFLEEIKTFYVEYFEHRRPTTAYVLCHGDFHYKNMMFKQNPCNVLLLDFQISYVGAMAMDVVYSMIMLLTAEQRIYHRDEVLEYYYKLFSETSQKINNNSVIPSYNDFRQEIKRLKYYELFLVVTFLPMWYEVLNGPADFERVFTDDEYCKQMYRNKMFIEELKLLLPCYEQLGYFEK